MKEMLSRAQIDSDKVKVSALTKVIFSSTLFQIHSFFNWNNEKAVQERDKQIEILKKQLEEFAKEMDKSTSVINNLNKTFYESKFLMLKYKKKWF